MIPEIKIHVTLRDDLTPEEKTATVEELRLLGVENINLERLEKYGILTGFFDPLILIREVKGVEAAEINSVKFATAPLLSKP